MITEFNGGYKFGRGQLTGYYLTGPLAGQGVYFGDVELTKSYSAGDAFKRYTATSANKKLTFTDYDTGDLTGTIQFFQWSEAAKDMNAMAFKTPADQAQAVGVTVHGIAAVDNRIFLNAWGVTAVVVNDGNGVVYDDATDYDISNDGKSPAVITIKNIPATAGPNVVVTFSKPTKKLSARYLLAENKFDMMLVFEERVKDDNPTPPATTVLNYVTVVLDGDVSWANTNADLSTVSAKWTAQADTTKPDGQEYGAVYYPEADD